MTIEERLGQLNRFIQEGRIIEAMHEFYAPGVVMQENSEKPTAGWEANLAREREFVAKTRWNRAELQTVIVDGNRSATQWLLDYIHDDWGAKRYTQVAVQEWENGRIVNERFFYSA